VVQMTPFGLADAMQRVIINGKKSDAQQEEAPILA
jgi:hypothetical protein